MEKVLGVKNEITGKSLLIIVRIRITMLQILLKLLLLKGKCLC